MPGKIYMIPVTLGGSSYSEVIPDYVTSITKKLRFFIVEDLRSARRFLKTLDKEFR
jgi:16S rRNA (cytidine1402-2'-O)-methyltransferase